MDKFISYDGLPIDCGGAHKLRTRNTNAILQSVNEFIKTFSNSTVPSSIKLTFYNSRNKSYSTWSNLFIIIKQHGLFFRYNNWDLKDYRQSFWTWKISNNKIEKALKTLDYFSTLPQNKYGPVDLHITRNFQFIDLKTKKTIPDQDKIPIIDDRLHNSHIRLTLGNKPSISVWFTLPFNNFEEHKDYINKMESLLPFKFSDKHWHQWTLSKNQKRIKRRINTISERQ